jgi:hypothetical protein
MASYFDVKPASSKGPGNLGDDDEVQKAFGKPSLFSPQVTSILDDLERDHSSSSSEEVDLNSESEQEEERGRKGNKDHEPLRKAKSSPLPTGSKKLAPSQRPRHPHLARFHSLRSMLFSSNIEDKMAQQREHQEREAAEARWREDYDKRQGLNRPKTPPSPKGSPTKEGFRSKMHSTLRRITSKESPPMMPVLEEDDRESTASDDEVNVRNFESGKKWDEKLVSDGESIHHSDVEDLVRWVSRRDPPSDGEARHRTPLTPTNTKVGLGAHDSGHESLGNDDIEELVRHVSRRPPHPTEEVAQFPSGYTDESTASDSEAERKRGDYSEDEDTEELMRWVSRKEGDRAGPVRETKETKPLKSSNLAPSDANDSDTAELVRWVTKKDETSGESDMEGIVNVQTRKHDSSSQGRESLKNDDVDELVRWVTNKDPSARDAKADTIAGIQAASKDLEIPGQETKKGTLTHDDVDELVRWVSKKNNSPQEELATAQRDDEILKWKKEEDEEKKVEVGMKGKTGHTGSLAAEDVDELVQWVSKKQ